MRRGTVVAGRYSVDALVGEGGMCRVYRAWQRDLDRDVALKILNDALAADERERERFLHEARTCATLVHPNIVGVFDAGLMDGRPYLAMEYVEGRTLEAILADRPEPAVVLPLLVQTALALAHAHGSGVVHRDLKPANILVGRDGVARVADWGLAKTTKDGAHLTRTGMVLGSPPYMAPERILEGAATPAVDLYALGVILFEAVAGRRPFTDLDTVAVLHAHLKERPPALERLAPHCPPELAALTAALLAKEPAERPATATAVAEQLAACSVADFTGPLATTRPVMAPARRRWPAAASAAVLLLVLVTAFWRAKQPSTPSVVPLVVRKVSLAATDRVEIRFSGRPTVLPLVWLDARGRPRHDIVPAEVDLHEGRPAGSSLFAVALPVTPPLVEPTELRYTTDGVTQTTRLDPTKLQAAMLDPLKALQGQPLTELLRRVRQLRDGGVHAAGAGDREKLADLQARLTGALAEAGLSEELLALWDRAIFAGLAPGRPYVKDPLAGHLQPLFWIESSLAHVGGIRPPWGLLTERVGQAFLPIALPSGLVGEVPDYEVRGTLPLSANGPVGGTYMRTVIGDPEAAGPTRAFIGVTDVFREGLAGTDGELPLSTAKLHTVFVGTVGIDPAGPWPLRRPFVALSLRYLPTDLILSFELNGSDPYLLSGAAGYATKGLSFERWHTLFVVPADPKDLMRGLNEFRLRARSVVPGTFSGFAVLSQLSILDEAGS